MTLLRCVLAAAAVLLAVAFVVFALSPRLIVRTVTVLAHRDETTDVPDPMDEACALTRPLLVPTDWRDR